MKDMRHASYVFRIKLFKNSRLRMLGPSQAYYVDKILSKYTLDQSKEALILFRHGLGLSFKMYTITQ